MRRYSHHFRRNLRLFETAINKKKCLKLGIIIFCILIPFLISYAETNDKVKDVKKIQTLLALLKFNPGPIDGIIGQKTTKAIRAFQLDIGVPVTGKIDGDLKSQLDRAYRMVVFRTTEQTGDYQ
jgi:hypothetical protein